MSIVEFLLARIAEDEAVARDRRPGAHVHQSGCYYYDYTLDANWFCDCDEDGKASAHLLAECAAKRWVLDTLRSYEPDTEWRTEPDMGKRSNNAAGAVRQLAAVYAGHEDYQQEWAL